MRGIHPATVVVAFLLSAAFPSMLSGQSDAANSREGALQAAGARLRVLFKHSIETRFADTLAGCTPSAGETARCEFGTPTERSQHEEIRVSLKRGFGESPEAPTLEGLLRVRSDYARTAVSKGSDVAKCGGPMDRPLATIFTISAVSVTDGKTLTTLIAHDISTLGGCPSGITVFEITTSKHPNGSFVAHVEAIQHLDGRLEGPRARRP